MPPSSPVPVTPTKNIIDYTPRRTSQSSLSSLPQQPQSEQQTVQQPQSPLPQLQQQQQLPQQPQQALPRQPTTPSSSIFSELAGLQPETSKSARRATYTGGILTPSTPSAMSPTSFQFSTALFQTTTIPTTTTSTTSTSSTQQPQQQNDPFKAVQQLHKQQQKPAESTKPEDDPYAALRGLAISSPEPPKPLSRQEPDIPNFHERQDSDEMSWTGELKKKEREREGGKREIGL